MHAARRQEQAVPATQVASAAEWTVPAVLAVVVAGWTVWSTFVLPFPFTENGVDARQRTAAFGIAAGVVAVGWLRRGGRGVGGFVLAYALVAVGLLVESFVLGYAADGPLAVAWWNDKVDAVLMLALCGAGATA